MLFFKILIGLPLIVALLVFAFVNNNMVELSLWPTDLEVTISQSVLIVLLYALGYIAGWFFTWVSYAPVRRHLRAQRRENRKMSKEQEKLSKEVEDLRGNIDVLKANTPAEVKPSFFKRLKNMFKSDSQNSQGE